MKGRRALIPFFLVFLILIYTLSLSAISASSAGFSGGDGTSDNPYRISNTTQLNNVRNHSDSHFILINDIVFSNNESFEPIGSSSTPFTGSFDGNGFNISGMIIKNKNRTAMFDTTGSGAVIKNLGIIDSKFTANQSTTTSDSAGPSAIASSLSYSAPFVITNKGTIENCFSNATVDAVATSNVGRGMASPRSCSYAAGITCENYGNIKNCYNRSQISAKANSWYYYTVTTVAESAACGIVVKMYSSSTVENCYSVSEGTATSTTGKSYYYNEIKTTVGTQEPIAGKAGGTINNCYYPDTIKNVTTGTPLSDSEMQQKENFTGFDFEAIWTIGNDADYLYPQLKGHEHSYTVEVSGPTCTKNGSKTYTCICNYSYTEAIPATGHDYEELVTPPTAVQKGYTTYTCSNCNDSYVDNYIDAYGFTLTGSVTSFSSVSDEISIRLFKQGEETASCEVLVSGNSAEYSFTGIESGKYILSVSKKNHTTRNYEITFDDQDIGFDIKIHLTGDFNGDGKINTIDTARANSHARGVAALSGYEFDCLDINGDGSINTIDVSKINAHAKGATSLW